MRRRYHWDVSIYPCLALEDSAFISSSRWMLGVQYALSLPKVSTNPKRHLPCIYQTPSDFVGTGFSNQFPGIIPHLLTLASNFRVPFYREVILALGICSVSKQSCSNILKGGPGQAITIVVGGAAESLSARPGTADLTLRKR